MAKTQGNILIIDDDDLILLSAQLLLEQHFSSVSKINNPHQIEEAFRERHYEVVLLDMNFKQGETSGSDGIKWLKRVKEISPESNVLLMTAYGEVDLAVEAMKNGAIDFIIKPWQNEKLVSTVRNALHLTRQENRVKQLEHREKVLTSELDQQYKDMIGSSPSMAEIRKIINKAAPTEADILILGENGTGKEVAARAIHKQSLRADEPFIAVDLGSITETLFESELFGHKKGAFTDAKEDRVGLLEAASGGTVFLDEIGNLPLAQQAKLLTVLQRRQVTRVGTTKPIDIDIRVISATNIHLKSAVDNGDFREDLYYRINTLEINLPPLRERLSDLEELTQFFINKYERKYHKQGLSLSKNALSALKKHSWPGNIRELQHAVERAAILSENKELDAVDFGFLGRSDSGTAEFDDYNLENIESWAIKKAISKHEGNISHAAKELGLSRGAMYRRMEKYGL